MKRLTFELGLSKEGVCEWSHCRVFVHATKSEKPLEDPGGGSGGPDPPYQT